MAASLFGLDAESVRRHHFPHADAWVTSSRPSLTTVTELIQEEAARMAGKLTLETIDASAIVVNSSAYNQCRQTVRMAVAARLVGSVTGADPEIAKTWRAEVKAFYEGLSEGGAVFLGDGAASSTPSEPDGPTDFISEHSLSTGDANDISDVAPVLRRSDQL